MSLIVPGTKQVIPVASGSGDALGSVAIVGALVAAGVPPPVAIWAGTLIYQGGKFAVSVVNQALLDGSAVEYAKNAARISSDAYQYVKKLWSRHKRGYSVLADKFSDLEKNISGKKRPAETDMPRPSGIQRTGGYYGRFYPGGEKKFFDTNVALTTVGSTGTILSPSINLVDQGNAQNQMVGRKILVKSVTVKALIRQHAETSSNANVVTAASGLTPEALRFYVILDKQCNGAAATVAQVLEDTDILSFNNLENSKRFKIMLVFQAELPLNGLGVTHDGSTFNIVTPAQDIFITKHFPCNEQIDFGTMAGGSRVITELPSANLFVMGISTSGSAAVRYRCRIRYEDA